MNQLQLLGSALVMGGVLLLKARPPRRDRLPLRLAETVR